MPHPLNWHCGLDTSLSKVKWYFMNARVGGTINKTISWLFVCDPLSTLMKQGDGNIVCFVDEEWRSKSNLITDLQLTGEHLQSVVCVPLPTGLCSSWVQSTPLHRCRLKKFYETVDGRRGICGWTLVRLAPGHTAPPSLPHTSLFGTHSVKHPVQQPWNHREDSGLKHLEVIHQKPDISLEKSYLSSMTQHYTLRIKTDKLQHDKEGSTAPQLTANKPAALVFETSFQKP